MVGEMAAGQSEEGQQAKRIEDTQRYVRRSSALLWEIKENRNVRQLLPYLPLPTGNMMTDTAYG
jgi:hypothetical protein